MKIRNIVAVVSGILVSLIIIVIGEALVHIMNPLPADVDMQNQEAFKAFIANAPVSLHLIILCNYGLACFLGGMTAAGIAYDKKMNRAMSLGGMFMGVGMFSLISLSHPIWVVICSVIVFLPSAYLGGMIGLRISTKKKKIST